jgi:cytochrome b involved in lipid metabolism
MDLTYEQCAVHNSAKDCWIVIAGMVYDVTEYLDEHPGGEDLILQLAGRDATLDFEDVGHTTQARVLLERFFIGECSGGLNARPLPPPLMGAARPPNSALRRLVSAVRSLLFTPTAVAPVR